jgi:hypothetical protein
MKNKELIIAKLNKAYNKVYNNKVSIIIDINLYKYGNNDEYLVMIINVSGKKYNSWYINNIKASFNVPTIIDRLLRSNNKYEILLGLNLLVNEK